MAIPWCQRRHVDQASIRSTRCWVANPRRQKSHRISLTLSGTRARARSGRRSACSAWGPVPFFCSRALGQVGGPEHRQARRGPPRQRAMPGPSGPTTHCIRLEPHLALGLCNALCTGPPAPRNVPHGCQCHRTWCQDNVGGQRWGRAQRPTDHAPAAPVGQQGTREGQPVLRIPAESLRSRSRTASAPAVRRQRGHARFDLGLLPATPPLLLARDGADRGLARSASHTRRCRSSP